MHIVHCPATLLKQTNDTLIFNLLVHFKFLECGIKRLQQSPKVIVVGEVGLGKLREREVDKRKKKKPMKIMSNSS